MTLRRESAVSALRAAQLAVVLAVVGLAGVGFLTTVCRGAIGGCHRSFIGAWLASTGQLGVSLVAVGRLAMFAVGGGAFVLYVLDELTGE